MKVHSIILPTVLFLLASLMPFASAATVEELATKTGATENKAPDWIKHGAYVYRILTPEDADALISTEKGLAITYHLLDDSVEQIPLLTGVIGDDHQGLCNWDGIWPYWSHVSYRARNWDYLRDFMQRASDRYNTKVSFHVNLTDVNVGLKAYPEDAGVLRKAGGNQIHLSPRLESLDKEAGYRTALCAAGFPRQGEKPDHDLCAGELQEVLG